MSSSVRIDANEGFLKGTQWPVLTVQSAGHALHVFVNGQLSGRYHGVLLKGSIKFIEV